MSSRCKKLQPGQPPKMTRKEALAVLHKVCDAVSWHLYDENVTEEEKALREQMYDALRILDVAVHGDPARYSRDLCHVCYLRQSTPDLQVYVKGHCIPKSCCATCLEQLKAEGKTERIEVWDWKAIRWVEEKREVQA